MSGIGALIVDLRVDSSSRGTSGLQLSPAVRGEILNRATSLPCSQIGGRQRGENASLLDAELQK